MSFSPKHKDKKGANISTMFKYIVRKDGNSCRLCKFLFDSCLLSIYIIQPRKRWHGVIKFFDMLYEKKAYYSSKSHDEAHHDVSFVHKESNMCKGKGMHWFHTPAVCSLVLFVEPLYVDIINLSKNSRRLILKINHLFEAQFTLLLGNCHVAHTIKWLMDKPAKKDPIN